MYIYIHIHIYIYISIMKSITWGVVMAVGYDLAGSSWPTVYP